LKAESSNNGRLLGAKDTEKENEETKHNGKIAHCASQSTNMRLHVRVCVYCRRGFGVARVDEAICASATALEAKQQTSKL
jgi:hypothetical protein